MAGAGRRGGGLSHSPRAMRSVSLGPLEVFLWGKRPFGGGQTSLGAPKGKCWGHVLLSPMAGFEAAVLSVFLGIQGVGGGKWASRNFRLCTAARCPTCAHAPAHCLALGLFVHVLLPCPGQLVLCGPRSWGEAGLGPQVTPLDPACETHRVWNALPPHLEL